MSNGNDREGWFLYVIKAVNCLSPNVWAFIFVIIGMILLLRNKDVVGASLVTGGFAVFQARLSGGRVSDVSRSENLEVRRELEIKTKQ